MQCLNYTKNKDTGHVQTTTGCIHLYVPFQAAKTKLLINKTIEAIVQTLKVIQYFMKSQKSCMKYRITPDNGVKQSKQ